MCSLCDQIDVGNKEFIAYIHVVSIFLITQFEKVTFNGCTQFCHEDRVYALKCVPESGL